VTEWNDSLGGLLGPAGVTPKGAMLSSRAVRRGRLARQRRVIIVLSALLFAVYGTATYLWFGDRVLLMAALTLCSLVAVAFVCLGVRALEDTQLSAARLRVAERRLARQNSLLQSTLEHMGEGLSVFDSQGRLIAWNFRFCELLDISSALAAGANLRDMLMLQAARGDFGEAETEAEVTRRLDLFYSDAPTIKDRVTPADRVLQIRRCTMPNGAILSVYSDVTEIRASERKLSEARSQAETANRAKGDFLANMSHELRTPLNAIIGFSEVISNELFGPIANAKYLEYIQDINASSLHLLSLINDLLDRPAAASQPRQFAVSSAPRVGS
jgi:signal transduction histidine kinase